MQYFMGKSTRLIFVPKLICVQRNAQKKKQIHKVVLIKSCSPSAVQMRGVLQVKLRKTDETDKDWKQLKDHPLSPSKSSLRQQVFPPVCPAQATVLLHQPYPTLSLNKINTVFIFFKKRKILGLLI